MVFPGVMGIVLLLLLAGELEAQGGGRPPAPLPRTDAAGTSVVVPRRGVWVEVPVSPGLLPSGPLSPAEPPGGMQGSASGELPAGPMGFLRIEGPAPAIRVVVDGRDVGPVEFPAGRQVLALPAGWHRVDLALAGGRSVGVDVQIWPGRTSVVRWPAEAGVEPEVDQGRPGGYEVIPPRATHPQAPRAGGGYFVVPKP
jgi:hypothetical protein